MYSSHYRILKCVAFESIHYAINLDVASYSKVNKIISLKKKIEPISTHEA